MPDLQRADTLSIHYRVDDFTGPWADAPILLLQHGNGRSGRFWYRWVPLLARHFRIVRPDIRGLGDSTRPADLEASLTLDNLVSDLVALLDHLGADRVHYCGESMGGILRLALAALHLERVASLALVSTPVLIED